MGESCLAAAGLVLVEPGPVFERHKAEALNALQDAADYLLALRRYFDEFPCADASIDAAMPGLQPKLAAADAAIGRFRATRDCRGSC